MGRRAGEQLTQDDFTRLGKAVIKHFSSAVIIVGFVGTVLWKAYAEDKVTEHVKEQIKPLEKKVNKLEQNQKIISFNTKKIELMLIKTLPDSVVKAAEREAQIFNRNN